MRGPLGRQTITVQKAIRLADETLPGTPAPDGETDLRGQRIIDIGAYIDSEPEAVWEFVARWGNHEDDDLRSAIATCLLEHLLEHHFESVFPRVERLVVTDKLFANTFTSCWKLGQAELPQNARRFDELTKLVLGSAA
jgi:hypothetical protein